MNAVSKSTGTNLALPERDAIRVLQASLYPGAKDESVALVLSWCRATGRDPMKKPVHIVPMNVKVGKDKWEWRDVLMPGIGTYRTDAARTGDYAGKTEPEFGPDVTTKFGEVTVTFPKWCKVTVKRLVGGAVRDFIALEYWMENYATAGKNDPAPNSMWRKRPYGQLAKCAESQALRMAFPEETGNTNTAEEMEGRGFEGVTIDAEPKSRHPKPEELDHRPELSPPTDISRSRRPMDDVLDGDAIPDFDPPKPDRLRKVADRIKERLIEARTPDDYNMIMTHQGIVAEWEKIRSDRPELAAELEEHRQAQLDRIAEEHAGAAHEPEMPA